MCSLGLKLFFYGNRNYNVVEVALACVGFGCRNKPWAPGRPFCQVGSEGAWRNKGKRKWARIKPKTSIV